MADAVRTPIGPKARLPKRRSFDERLIVRWPGMYAAITCAVLRLSPRSRLRRTLLRRSAVQAWGAWVRGDLELVLVRFAPGLRYEPPREWQAAGMRSVYEGHAGFREWTADMRDAWEWIDNTPLELVDGGDVLVFTNHVRLRARGSGIEFDTRFGFVLWIEQGLIVRECDYSDLDEALRVAGISLPVAG